MLRRRFVLGAASAAAAVPLASLPGCGGGSSTNEPAPVPPSNVVLHLPADMYMHPGAPTEWWWHTGTLKAGNRVFGFEINAAGFLKDGFAFTQVMVTDVQNNKHYQRTTPYAPPVQYNANTWAESDTTKDWYARLGSETNQGRSGKKCCKRRLGEKRDVCGGRATWRRSHCCDRQRKAK